jgi:ABC-2 type transport system ATP-binding protein
MEIRMETAISCRGLVKNFAGRPAVDGIDLEVPARAVYGFVGRNGAGKTTTIRLLLGLLRPDAGSVRILGFDMARQRIAAARHIGAMVETPSHYDHLTGRQNLDITRRLLGAGRSEIGRVLEVTGMAWAADRRVGGYSLGMRQRLGVARALLGRPKLLILDEPGNGLDPEGIIDMRNLIGGLPDAEGVTILVSSHVLAEVEQVATHIGLMHEGRLLLQAPAAGLGARQATHVRFEVDRPDALIALLGGMGIEAVAGPDGTVAVAARSADKAARRVAEINFCMVEQGLKVRGIQVREPSLEEIFLELVASHAAPANPAALQLAA